jgi:hypothetical protein
VRRGNQTNLSSVPVGDVPDSCFSQSRQPGAPETSTLRGVTTCVSLSTACHGMISPVERVMTRERKEVG